MSAVVYLMQHGRECQNVVHGLGLVLMKMFVKCLYENVFSNYLKYIIFIPGVPKKTIPSLISCNVKPIKAISLK